RHHSPFLSFLNGRRLSRDGHPHPHRAGIHLPLPQGRTRPRRTHHPLFQGPDRRPRRPPHVQTRHRHSHPRRHSAQRGTGASPRKTHRGAPAFPPLLSRPRRTHHPHPQARPQGRTPRRRQRRGHP